MTDSSDGNNAMAGDILRGEIEGEADSIVAIFPTKKSGVGFLQENNAWGFVTISGDPDFVAIYVSENVREVRYIASVKEIVSADEAPLAQPPEEYEFYDSGKKVVTFEPNSLYQIKDPIPYEDRVPYALRYTDLDSLRTAENTNELF